MVSVEEARHPKATYILGLDLARHGADESAFIVVEQAAFKIDLKIVYIETTQNKPLTDAIGRAVELHKRFNFSKIYIDETGLGSGVVDVLKEKLGHIIEGFTFSMKSKGDLVSNLKLLMQQGKLKIPMPNNNDYNTKKLTFQFNAIQHEYGSTGAIKIFHEEGKTHDDMIMALALACWHFRPSRNVKKGYGLAGGSR